MNADTRGSLFAAALVGGLVFLAPSKPGPAPKQTVVSKQSVPATKAPVQKSGAPAQRTTPIPRPRPPAAIVRPERKAVKKRQGPSTQRAPTASQCTQMRGGIDTIGRSGVRAAARLRGYSDEQIDSALRHCRL